jgi:hypothetical protein
MQLDNETIERCIQITDSFRIGERTKGEAYFALQSALAHNRYEPAIRITALDHYIEMLDNYDQQRNAAAQRGNLTQESSLDPIAAAATATGRVPSPDLILEHTQGRIDEEEANRQDKRPRSPAPDEENEKPQRPKIDIKALPWVQRDEFDPPNLTTELRETLRILENISRDPKTAKASLTNSARCPEFPSSEWDNLLAGRSINLDHVFASGYNIIHEEKRSERLGEIEVIVGTSKPARTVDSHGKWVIAWEKAADAITYVFPHRCKELRNYSSYIKRLFAALPESYHSRVINFDKAVRIRCAQRRDLLLTSPEAISDLYILWIQSPVNPTPSDRTKNFEPKRRDPCRRWNEGRCPNTNISCSYRHICIKCKSPGHTSADCTRDAPQRRPN